MVTVKIGDGLGNQIYNYVCGYAAARKRGEKLRLDRSDADNSKLRYFMLDKLKLDDYISESFSNKTVFHKIYKRLRRNIKYNVIFENRDKLFELDERIFEKSFRDIYLHGYWQIIDYFNMYKEDIIRQIQPAWDLSQKMLEMKDYFQNDSYCSLHLRGGDIEMLPAKYYLNAIDSIRSKKKIEKFICFTNDKEKASSVLSLSDANFEWIDSYGDFEDIEEFFLMSYFNNQIISDSTFSRWASLINTKENRLVAAPSKGKMNSRVYPEDWITL